VCHNFLRSGNWLHTDIIEIVNLATISKMKLCVCLICLSAIDSTHVDSEIEGDGEKNEGVPLLTRFSKFVDNFLQVKPVAIGQLSEIKGGDTVFCEKCELEVINPIYQLYLNLLSTQLQLSWQVGQLGKLLETSERSTSDKLRSLNLKALTNQLGIENVAQLEEFRRLLAEKCKLNLTHYYLGGFECGLRCSFPCVTGVCFRPTEKY